MKRATAVAEAARRPAKPPKVPKPPEEPVPRGVPGWMLPQHQQQTSWGATCRKVLALLPENGAPISLRELKEKAGPQRWSMEHALNSLIDDGIVKRQRQGIYRRVV